MNDNSIGATPTKYLSHVNSNIQFIVPVFQRNYCWQIEQCARLWNDIENSKEKGHFLGIFVNVHNDGTTNFHKWLVIDGQQRLTTLTLLMVALRNYLNENECSGTLSPEEIEKIFLINESKPIDSKDRFKLLLRGVDDKTMRKYVNLKDKHELDNESEENYSESIQNAYEYFRNKLAETKLDLNDVYKKVSNLSFVVITLKHNDEPQFVFETLNSTGVDLSQSDLVRNFLLMGLREPEQNDFYDKYWSKIEKFFEKSSNFLDDFLRDYIVLKERITKPIKNDEIYDSFKRYKDKHKLTSENILKDLIRYAPHYAKCVIPWSFTQGVSKEIYYLREYGTTHAILLMKLGDLQKSGKLGNDDYLKMLSWIDSYLLRRVVTKLTTKSYRSRFASIAHSVDENDPINSFQIALDQLSGNYENPNDEVFRTALETNNLFRLRLCHYILSRLENYEQNEPSPTRSYEVEHILPQNTNLNEDWRDMLGDDWEDEQNTWVHRLGNLTLSGYNQKYSDRSFEYKKKIKDGFEDSAVRLNKYVREQDQWTEKEIEERGKILSEIAMKIWPYLHVDREVYINDLEKKASQRSIQDVDMNAETRKLFCNVHSQIINFEEVITVVEGNSACLFNYKPEFIAELIPRSKYITILLNIEVDGIENPTSLIENANKKKFPGAKRRKYCRSFINIWTSWAPEQIDIAVQVVKRACNVI